MNISKITKDWCKKNNINFEHFDSVESTNTIAKQQIPEMKNNFNVKKFYFASEQTSGRGRSDNQWVSPGVETSFLWSWTLPANKPFSPTSSPTIGWIVYHSCSVTWPDLNFKIKPPNDIFIDDKKVGGILLEGVQQGNNHYLIVGIGLNLLKAPELLKTSTFIYKNIQVSPIRIQDDVIKFLNNFHSLLDKFREKLLCPTIDSKLRTDLAKAIGALEVTETCDIIYSNSRVSWKEL